MAVGAGFDWISLAISLSSNPDYRVLLLESGGNPNPLQNVPAYFQSLLHIPEIDYGYYTVPQRNACLALKKHRSYWPRGMGLGGSSNLNTMIWQRSSPHDYDKWAKLSGSDEWKFENIFTNFKNIEDYHGQYYNEKWHSQDGQGIYVSTAAHGNLVDEFFEAGREMGYPTKDVNGNQESSFSRLDLSIKDGRRFGAYQGFLEPVFNRTNLHIYRFARVNKIHLGKDNRAYAVTYKRHVPGQLIAKTTHVNLALGPKTAFRKLNTFSKQGLHLASAMAANAVATFTVHLSEKEAEFWNKSPDIQCRLFPANPKTIHEALEVAANVKPGLVRKYLSGLEEKDIFMVNVMLGKPSSRGDIKLASTDPLESLIMDPKYFSHPDDIRRMVDGMKFTVQMVENTKAFQRIGARFTSRHFPGCEKYELKTDQYYECCARHMTFTVYHQSGTCTMGYGPDDPKAVVDYKLRVLYTKGLRGGAFEDP
ncbi:Glucose dehydrogenase [FAD, quinone] [Orchesella cincta]|uniref:Glucose dehydrogenase [FAD, quinone] n=1 Tax=Orchesella cincta TaxID=48709 RepID=A0A1D2M870_ORCCI|nr:Glucose dehydrogenase [FAD, quinone] [Orchesella cincta]